MAEQAPARRRQVEDPIERDILAKGKQERQKADTGPKGHRQRGRIVSP